MHLYQGNVFTAYDMRFLRFKTAHTQRQVAATY